jgi:hypothetical protein
MAGLGKKTFTAGDVLIAGDVNSYLMDQTVMNFATVAARSSAIPVPSTGMVSYVGDTGTDAATNATIASVPQIQAYTGAAWQNLDGLTLVAKATIGSGITSFAMTDVYSASYNAYKIIITGGVASTATDLTIINTGSTASYAYSLIYLPWGGSIASITSGSTSSYPFAGHGATNVNRMSCDVINPFTATHTQFMANYVSGTVFGTSGCLHSVATSYTGFTIAAGSGTITGGTVHVYGYRSA